MKKNQYIQISTIYMMTFGQRKILHMTLKIIFFKILILTIHYDYSISILIKFLKLKK